MATSPTDHQAASVQADDVPTPRADADAADPSPAGTEELQPPAGQLAGYAVLAGIWTSLVAAWVVGARRSGRELPQRLDGTEIALLGVATFRASRLVTKDKVALFVRAPFVEVQGRGLPGEVEQRARGRGARRAIGQLLTCPYCLAMWIAAALLAGITFVPRTTRAIATVFAVVTTSDVLQRLYYLVMRERE